MCHSLLTSQLICICYRCIYLQNSGLAPRRREEPTGDLEANELKELLRRGDADRDGLVGERIEGIGAAPVGSSAILDGSNAAPKKTKTLAERYKDQLASGLPDTTHALPGTIHITTEAGSDAVSSSRTATGASGVVCKRDNETKEERRARKAALKAAKKAKKHAKKAAKRAKRKDEERSDSDSDSDEDIDKRGRSQSPRSSRQARQLTRSRSDSRRRSHERRSFDQRRSSRRSRSRSLERRHSSRRSSYRRSRSRSYSPRRSDRQRDSDRHREHRHDDYASRRR